MGCSLLTRWGPACEHVRCPRDNMGSTIKAGMMMTEALQIFVLIFCVDVAVTATVVSAWRLTHWLVAKLGVRALQNAAPMSQFFE